MSESPINESSTGASRLRIFAVGFSHQTAPIGLRERLAFHTGGVAEPAQALVQQVPLSECVLLSTCNRSEIYAAAGAVRGEEILAFLSSRQGIARKDLESHRYEYHDRDAVRHLCRVASGLDSMVLGEQQILGQVKEAAEAAAAAHTTGPILSALFRQALTAGKRARNETAISRGAVSVSHAAVELARQIFGDLSTCRVLLLGAGEMSEITLKLLRNGGMRNPVRIISRTRERANALAVEEQGLAMGWDDLPKALVDADIVIVSTSAPHYIVRPEHARPMTRARRGRSIFFIDMSVPRNVDPAIGDLADVFLYNIDDLQEVARRNLEDRSQEVAKVEAIIEDEVERFIQWQNGLGVVPAIKELRHFAESVREQEWTRLEPRLAHLPDRDRELIELWTHQFINRLLHQPTIQLRSLGVNGKGYDRVEVVRELFGAGEETTKQEAEKPVPAGDEPGC